MKILRLKPLPKGVFVLEIENQGVQNTIELHQETVFSLKLMKHQTLSEKEWQQTLEQDAYYRLYAKALKLLAGHDHTEQALRNKLRTYTDNAILINQVLNQVITQGYINEERALSLWVEDFLQGPPKGPRLMKHKLEHVGFPSHLVQQALNQYTETRQEERCLTLCESLIRTMGKKSSYSAKQKLLTSAITKGFSQDMAERTIQQLEQNFTSFDDNALLIERIEKLSSQYKLNDFKDKQKLIQKLLREGFRFDAIKKHVK